MITRSSRIRWAETPDVPGAVPPVPPAGAVPPVPPAGVPTPAPTAAPTGAVPPVVPPTVPPTYATGPQPGGPKKSSKGLLIGLIAGGAALVVVAIIAVVALVLPAIFGSGGGTSRPDVIDIADEPDTTWKYDWVGDNDEEYLEDSPNVTTVGEGLVLVSAEFDYYAYLDDQGDSAGWYDGYDEHYDLGYQAGIDYLAAWDAWIDNYDADYPDREDYYPDGFEEYSPDWQGWYDGFYDGYYGDGEGYSKKEKPVDPDYTPTVTLLNTANGDEEWTVDLSEAIDGVDFSSTVYTSAVRGADAVAIAASIEDEDETTYVLATLSTKDGKVLSQLESDEPLNAGSFKGNVIVTSYDEDGDSTVASYPANALDDDPEWETDGPSGYASVSPLGDKWLQVSGDDEGFVLDAATGEEAEFGDDIDDDVSYSAVGDQIIRLDYGGKSTEIVGINPANGDETWDDTIKTDAVRVVGGNLYIAESNDDEYTDLMRINPSNGSEQWGETYGEDFDGFTGFGNNLLVSSGKNVYVLDAGNGQEKFKNKSDEGSYPYVGANAYYVNSGDALTAYSYGEKGDIWEFEIDDDEQVMVLGQHFVLIDDKGEIHGLG